jgi:hypothetical protein
MGRIGGGRALICLEREDHWQIGYIIGNGGALPTHMLLLVGPLVGPLACNDPLLNGLVRLSA